MARDRMAKRFKREPLPKLQPRPEFRRLCDEEVAERIISAASGCLERAPYPYVIQHSIDVYAVPRRWASESASGHGYTSRRQLCEQLYAEVGETMAELHAKWSSVRRHLKRLEAAGVLRVRELVGPRDESRGLYWELIAEPVKPELYPGRPGRSSSAGQASFACELERVRLPKARRAECRVNRPHTRRIDRGCPSDLRVRITRCPSSSNRPESGLAPLRENHLPSGQGGSFSRDHARSWGTGRSDALVAPRGAPSQGLAGEDEARARRRDRWWRRYALRRRRFDEENVGLAQAADERRFIPRLRDTVASLAAELGYRL